MARRLNGYQLRLVCHKAPSLDRFFSLFILKTIISDILLSTVKLFPDDTSLFSVVNYSNISANELNKNLQKISEWAYKWKMSFNPDLNKKAQKVVFSGKLNKSSHPKIFFNNVPVVHASWQKHLGMFFILKARCPKQGRE